MNILIMGAGPSGTACAIQAAKAGINVTIIDCAGFPRFRPGESCHPGIEALLKQLGVWKTLMESNPLRHDSLCINNRGTEATSFFNEAKDWKGFQFPRETFDLILLEEAIALGVKFIPATKTVNIVSKGNTITSIVTDKGEFQFDFLVDATGSKSIASIKLGLTKEKHSKLIIAEYMQLFTEAAIPEKLNSYFEITDEYWGYIAQIKPQTYSVTYSSASNAKWNRALFVDKHFADPYVQLVSKGYETSWSIVREQRFENLYLVGDAMMTFDPTSSKGILKALMTGVYTAYILENIHENKLTTTQAKAAYESWAIDFFENELAGIKQILPEKMAGIFDYSEN